MWQPAHLRHHNRHRATGIPLESEEKMLEMNPRHPSVIMLGFHLLLPGEVRGSCFHYRTSRRKVRKNEYIQITISYL